MSNAASDVHFRSPKYQHFYFFFSFQWSNVIRDHGDIEWGRPLFATIKKQQQNGDNTKQYNQTAAKKKKTEMTFIDFYSPVSFDIFEMQISLP